jgi:hypothetical protein
MAGVIERSVTVEIILDILKFPLWWYTAGLWLMLQWSGRTVSGYARFFAIEVWIKNIFVPMFGQYDWQSRIISVFMRIVQIIGRSIALFIVMVLALLVVLIYLFGPVALVGLALYHLTSS